MISRLLFLTCACLCAQLVDAWPAQYGPFPANNMPTLFPIHLCTVQEQQTAPGFARPTTRVYGRTGQLVRVRLELDTQTYAVLLSVVRPNGQLIHGPKTICDTIEWGDMGPVYSADMNRDGIPDFVAFTWHGGCGLACGYYTLAFVLSARAEYKVSVTETMFPDEHDFVDLRTNGSCQFIQTRFVHGESEEDRHEHDCWMHSILTIEGTWLRPVNEIY